MPVEKTFKINEYLTVKLKGREIVIYVVDKPFNQCKALLLNIPVDDVEKFDEIESIDEVAEMLSWDVNAEHGQEGVEYNLSPEIEFFGHCSNLQAWWEQKYDTNLLHSHLAFPLLKRLTDVGDKLAQKVFKEEITKRFAYGLPSIIQFLDEEGYLEYLGSEELIDTVSMIMENEAKFLNNYERVFSILESLAESGVSRAQKLFKEEISKKFRRYTNVMRYLFKGNFLNYLDEEERLTLINTPELKRISFLISEIKRHQYLCYLKHEPEVSDAKYDALKEELRNLDPQNPFFFPFRGAQLFQFEVDVLQAHPLRIEEVEHL